MSKADRPIALVTGASRGLGYSVARRLGAGGHQVIAMARTVGGLEDLADDILRDGGPNPTLVPLSLTDDGGLQRLCLAVHERWGRLDLVVHCAAHAPPLAPAHLVDDKDFDAALDVNFRGTRRLVLMVQPLLAAAPAGRFVHVTDDRAGQPFYGAYGATKTAADAFIRTWQTETRKLPPDVTLFQPEPMPTALRARFLPGEDASRLTPCEAEAARLLDVLGLGIRTVPDGTIT